MLLDTSGLFALHDRTDPHHAAAVAAFDAATTRRVTHAGVLDELVPLGTRRRLPRRPLLQFLFNILADTDIDVVWVDEVLHRRGLALLVARPDKTYSLCDAVSFTLMRDRGLTDALTADTHFAQEGFRKLLG
jgi:predicted nucleic acid-binding protein